MENEDKTVSCTHCNHQFDISDLDRYCSNCFGCTGCERYVCPVCDKLIVVTEIKPPCWD